MERSERRRLAMFGACALGLAACHLFVTMKVDPDPPAALGDAGDAASDSEAADAIGPCSVQLPQRPGSPSEAGAARTLLFAPYLFANVPIDSPDLCPSSALDLDGVNTSKPECTNTICQQLDGAATQPGSQCDGPGGVDNALLLGIQKLSSFPGGAEAQESFDFQPMVERGILNLLVEVQDYDGDDDDSVQVNFYLSAGIEGTPPGHANLSSVRQLPVVWDGGQDAAWTLDESSVIVKEVGGTGRVVEARMTGPGYVRGGILVVPHTGPGVFPTGASPTLTSDSTLTARIERDGDKFKLTKGRFASILPSDALLGLLGSSSNGQGPSLCENEGQYQLVRAFACGGLDMSGDASAGGVPYCNAVSVGIGIAAVEGRIATFDGGDTRAPQAVVQPRAILIKPPCVDGGSIWCDDCAWDAPRRCPLPGDAGDAGDAGGALDAGDAADAD